METNLSLEKRAIDLTAKDIAEIVATEIKKATSINTPHEPSYSYKGIGGIMQIFQCSKSKATAIRASGIIDDACVQNGNSFLVDKSSALQLMKDKPNRRTIYSNK